MTAVPGRLGADVLESLLGPAFSVEVAAPSIADEELFADERQYIAPAVPLRRAEFGTARTCSRRALARLGVAPCSLVPHPDRSPRWPPGVIGSISHTVGCCVVAVSVAPDVVGIGVDVETDTCLEPELQSAICTEAERAWLRAHPGDSGRLSKLLFSAKEAVYKCQYPITGTVLDFHDVELTVDLERQTFRVTRGGPLNAQSLQRLAGAFATPDGFVVCAAVWPGSGRDRVARDLLEDRLTALPAEGGAS